MKTQVTNTEYLISIEILEKIHERLRLERQLALPKPIEKVMIEEITSFQHEEDEICLSEQDIYRATCQMDD